MDSEVASGDINDAFDAIAFSEDRIAKEAFLDGFKKGESDGYKEGFHLGYHNGVDLGREFGFYRGVLQATSLISMKSLRVHTVRERLLVILDKIPTATENDCDFREVLNSSRALFKQYVSLLKLNLELPVCNLKLF